MTFQGNQFPSDNKYNNNNKGEVVFQTGSNITEGNQGRNSRQQQQNFMAKKMSSQSPNAQAPVLPQQENPRQSVSIYIN